MTEETRAVDGDMTATETRAAPTAQASQPDAETIRAAERQRSAEIMTLCQRHGFAEMATDLIATGASVDAARAALLDKLAARDPGGRVAETAPAEARSGGERELAFRDAVSTALMHRSNPGAVTLTPDAREFRGLSLLELARDVLERRGTSVRGLSKMEIAGQAFAMRSGGFHSTSDFPSILANVANKTLRAAYESTPRTFAAWCRRAVITDFKPVSRTQLGGAPDLLKVLESSEIQYGTMGESAEVYALASYARIVALTRQTIINDDLDAFTRVPAAFGAAAADLESDIVYSILIDNPDMADGTDLFHADHGNLLSAARIAETSLADAYKAFGKQTGLEGRKISVLPRFLIVPPGPRAVEARKNITATTPDSVAGVNAFANRLEVVEEPRLIPASGEDPWFMAADPARIDTVEYAYLDGQEGVYTETEMGFEVDGLKIKARHDFAAKAIDWRGLLKNPGAAPA